MISVVVATHESERSLVPTLAALVAGVTGGLLGEVVVADAGSRDATAQVAEVAGCRFVVSAEPLGARLKVAAASTRGTWLMFLPAGTVLEPGWVGIVERFIERADLLEGSARAAVFRPPGFADLLRPGLAELLAVLRATFGGGPKPDQGLLISRALYDEVGGHRADENADALLLRRLGRRRIAMLPAAASLAR